MKKRIALAFALLTLACVAALTWLAYVNSEQALRVTILRESAAALSQTELQIDLTLGSVKRDVLFLAGVPPIRGIQRARRAGGYDAETKSSYAMWVERFQEVMAAMLRSKPDYWQARYIDERGQERVRVDSLNGRIAAVPRRALQNKAQYSYFTETMKLAPGAVYVSRLDLNRELGKIEVPHRPTLRVATPIVDILGNRQGIVIVNLHAQGLLDSIRGPVQALGGQTYMVNQDGYFLSHPDPTKTFGFDLDFDYRLRSLHPRLAGKLAETKQYVEYAGGSEPEDGTPHIHGFTRIAYDPNRPQRYWAVILDLPASTAFAPVYALRDNLLAAGTVIAALGALAGMLWARRFARQAETLTATAGEIARGRTEMRVEPERMVAEFRTLGESFNHMVESLLASEARSTDIVNYASDAIVTTDEEQRIRAFNHGAERIFGYSAAEVMGRPLDILLPEDRVGVHRRHMLDFTAEPELARAMGRSRLVAGRRKDGSEFPAEANVSKLREGGRWVFTAFLRDVSERMRAEEEREKFVLDLKNAVAETNRQRAQLEAVFQVMQDGITVFDTQGNVVLLNEAEARINGFASAEAMRQNLDFFAGVYELSEPDGQPVPVARWPVSRCLQGETLTNCELRGRRKDTGQAWFFSFSGAPVRDAQGNQILAVIITRDITEYRKAEDEIRALNTQLEARVQKRTAELAAVNKELEAFSYSVSHDLRAPLRSIDGFSQALLEDYAPRLDAPGQDYLRRVRTATQRMAELIDDLLQLSRVTRAEMRRETIDLSALAADIAAALHNEHPERTVELRIEPGLITDGDPRLVRILLNNLLDNAWKFTGKRADARVELGLAGRENDRPVFFVRDNGAGFDPAYADKLFMAFQRLHSPAEFPGTGIGLATAQRIVRRHGGRVWAEAAVDQGATFYFTLS